MRDLRELVRPNILGLEPYHSARDEYQGENATVFLDANENPYNTPYNRYPDPLQWKLKGKIAAVKGVRPEQVFLGNGSDEAIDLAFRIFCRPGMDNVVAITPTYGMYEVCAEINDVEYRTVPLEAGFRLDARKLLAAANEHTKLIFLCTPNNPTGNDLDHREIKKVVTDFDGIVIVDEAYSDFSDLPPFREELDAYPNLVVLNTFSKAWGCAAIRLGMAFASPEIIAYYNKVKYPYNINELTQEEAARQLERQRHLRTWLSAIKTERGNMLHAFSQLPLCRRVYPSNANFFLAEVTDANRIYGYLVDKGIIVRNRNSVTMCGNCLRITIGTVEENAALLSALIGFK